MYFKKLEIVGFKSFMDKTVLNFEPGVTAIVGPNGCGKSNIFDSIRWVLGEQSVKSLRGSQMEDVIFNGTDNKQPLGMAEVSLTFDNDSRFFSVDHNEVTITRRIFRSGESEYLINKSPSRLKDILELLMGTGIGAESYSLVAQGKIDLILSSRPEDRRMVFDEASGITKYKAQKKEAARKLEETEQNLLRLNDIILEVRRSIGYLERQASKARRYKEVYQQLRDKELLLAATMKTQLQEKSRMVDAEIDGLKAREELMQESVGDCQGKLDSYQEELAQCQDAIEKSKAEIMQLENVLIRLKQHVNFNRERIKELENSKRYLNEQLTQTSGRLRASQEKLDNFRQEHLQMQTAMEEKTALLKDSEDKLNSLIAAIKQSSDSISQAKKDIIDTAAKVSHYKNEIIDANGKDQVLSSRQKRLRIEKAKVDEEKAQAQADLAAIESELLALEQAFEDICSGLSGARQQLDSETKSLGQIVTNIGELEKKRITLQSQKEFLDKLRSEYEGIDTSMNAVIYLDKPHSEKISGLVIKVKDYQPLCPQELCEGLNTGLKLSGEAKPIDLDTQLVSDRIKQIEELLSALKENKQDKEKLISELNATICGLQEQRQQQEMGLAKKKAFHHTILEQNDKIKEEEQVIALELSDVESEMNSLRQRLDALKPEMFALETAQKQAEDLIHKEQENITASTKQKEGMLVGITQTRTELDALIRKASSEEATLKNLEEEWRQDKESLASIEEQITSAQAKQDSLSLEIEDLEEKIGSNAAELDSRRQYLQAQAEKKHEQLNILINELSRQISDNKKRLEELREKSYSLQMQKKDLEFSYQSLKERIMQSYRVDMEAVVDSPAQIPEQGEQASQPQGQAAEEPAQGQAVLPQQDIPLVAPVTPPTQEELQRDIQVLKSKVESYGNVNLVAIEEYEELKKRYDFLTQQQEDLIGAKNSLQDAIQKINRTTRKLFLETFEKVGVEFRNYFKLLFNGGDAQLFLIDEQNPLECGIEIICRPPGKKLQNVLLLSGGEKSMAAVALIFAIFKVKPAPFCILDEIDAALDEANVVRFGSLLQEFTGTSQFIIITHNKRTIANADLMYGITMAESGVSKIVSVKFSPSKQQQEAAVAV